jgi:hypothetical protein
MVIHIVDESGELVAICKHCAVVVGGTVSWRSGEVRKLYRL